MHQIDIEDLTGAREAKRRTLTAIPLSHAPEAAVTRTASGKERAKRHRDKMTNAGFVQVNLWVPAETVADFKQAEQRLRNDRDLSLGPLRRHSTGKLEKL